MDALASGRFVGRGVVTREGTGRNEVTGKLWCRAKVMQFGVTHNFMCEKDVFDTIPEHGGEMEFVCQVNQRPTASGGKGGKTFVNELYELKLEAVGPRAFEMLQQMAGMSNPLDPLAPPSEGRRSRQSAGS